jgi:hypothetical protein
MKVTYKYKIDPKTHHGFLFTELTFTHAQGMNISALRTPLSEVVSDVKREIWANASSENLSPRMKKVLIIAQNSEDPIAEMQSQWDISYWSAVNYLSKLRFALAKSMEGK